MAATRITIEGAKELEKKLFALEQKVGRKIVRQAVREGQRIYLQTAKLLASLRIGGSMGSMIAGALEIRAPKRRQSDALKAYTLQVQLSGKYGAEFTHRSKSGKITYIPAALEYGHGRSKEQAARPFMRPAFETAKDAIISRLTDVIREGIKQIARTG